jgi:hypothetical protein
LVLKAASAGHSNSLKGGVTNDSLPNLRL